MPQRCFWEHGFDAASYANIMAATGLKKGNFYLAFGDKRALYLTALACYDSGSANAGVAMLRNKNLSAADRIGALMQSLVDAAETRALTVQSM